MSTIESGVVFTEEGKRMLITILAERMVPRDEFFKTRYANILDRLACPVVTPEDVGFCTIASALSVTLLNWTDEEVIRAFDDETLVEKVFTALEEKGEVDAFVCTLAPLHFSQSTTPPTLH